MTVKRAIWKEGAVYLQEYARLRGNEQEVAYNMGRAAHQLGLVHLAVSLYERALASSPPAGAVVGEPQVSTQSDRSASCQSD